MNEPTARDMIHYLLDQCRPDRYDPEDKDWQSPVVDAVAETLTAAEARSIAAVKLVSTAEATATRRTNKLLREVADTEEVPLGWFDAMPWPLAVDENQRVALRAATPEDFHNFANRERRAAANDFASRNESCEGAILLADLMVAQGCAVAADLAVSEAAS